MFNRAVRDWLPLVTTNIRLRNLIKITAVELHCDNSDFVYFTLHLSAFSKPFYTSSSVEIRNGKANWPEINCEICRESSHKFICIRIWQKSSSTADSMLFLWGIYFSGLVLIPSTQSSSQQRISNEESISFKENTLLFQLDGGIFTSNEQIIYEQCNNRPDSSNGIIPSSAKTSTIVEAELNCDIHQLNDKYSTSNINIANGNNKALISPSTSPSKSLNYENGIEQDPQQQEGASNAMDILNNYPKVRYVQLKFPKNEIQQSYQVDRLIKMQEKQRLICDRKKQSKVIADRICMKCPACLNLDLINTAKPIFYEPQKQPGMGRTLSRLLARAPPKPEVLLKSHELQKKIEGARFRIKLLLQERDRCRQGNRQLEATRENLRDENTETETRIWNSLRTLNRENLRAYEEKLALQRETFMNIKLALLETRRNLLKDLNEVYEVKKCDRYYTINGIHLPDAESYGDTQSTAIDISIALGYVAHCVLIISRILNVPLRNPIKHEGSRSRIMDSIKVLPPADRTFPLFSRSLPPSNVLLYGVYLLNQNISQLKFMLGMSRGDLRATLANLWDLLNGFNADLYNRRFVEDVRPIENSASSVDSVPIKIPLSLSLSPLCRRKSRSLEDFEDSLSDSRENINSSAPDLRSPDANDHDDEDEEPI